jgi:Fe-S-cluster containining protein
MSECQLCGECCRVLVVPFVDAAALRGFLDARGIRYTEPELGRLDAMVPHTCPHLVDGLCDMEGCGKPLACRLFPAADQVCLFGGAS